MISFRVSFLHSLIQISYHYFILIKKTLQGLQALQPNNNTKLIIKKTILKNKQNYTIYDDVNGTSFGDMIIII